MTGFVVVGSGTWFDAEGTARRPGPRPHRPEEVKATNESLMDAVEKIDVDDPDAEMDMADRLFHRGEPYTGEVVEYLGGALVNQETYVEGRPDGLSRSWYKDGTAESEGTLRRGRPTGVFREWHPNGVLKSRQVFDEAGLVLTEEERWDESGRQTKNWKLSGS
ncbi:toxin-antitoxin system YwqK family antitoxin [Streptomyces goshikiensis]|uniref:toxin-antitoxin system YwqK family antitoxin n=1 Tax=Streptomyces goshikiensis TaxID=1942 RepID=UPI0036531A0B